MNEDLAPFFRAEQADLLHDLHVSWTDSAVRGVMFGPAFCLPHTTGPSAQFCGEEDQRAG